MKIHRNEMWPQKATVKRKIHEFDYRKLSMDHSLGVAALVTEFYIKVSHLSVLRRCSHSEGARLKSRAKYRLPWQVYRGFFQSFLLHLIHLITVPHPLYFNIQQSFFYPEKQTASLIKSRIKNVKIVRDWGRKSSEVWPKDLKRHRHKFLFYNKFVIFLYMFRPLLCSHHQEVKIVLYSIWYRHTLLVAVRCTGHEGAEGAGE